MAEKYCPNCCKNISAATFFLHERMCSINVKKCPKCNKPFTVDDLQDHIQEAHTEVECEYCKKKFSKGEIENHKKRCDSKLVVCSFCELNVLLGELKEHQKACGAITEPCVKCNRYIQRKDMDKHLLDGCPPPKNNRRSVDVVRNSNSRLSLEKNMNKNNNNINNNYIPINIDDYVPDELFFEEDNKKVDIKIHENLKKPNLAIRPPSGKKLLNEKAKRSSSNIGNIDLNKNSNINKINNIINNKETNNNNNKHPNTNISKNTTKNTQTKKPVRKEADKAKMIAMNHIYKKNDYLNKQNNANKQAVSTKPLEKEKKEDNKYKINNINSNTRYGNRDNKKKLSSKPNFNITKGSMKSSTEKEKDEEFRKTRDKLTFGGAKNISNKNMNDKNAKKNNYVKEKEKEKKIISDEDYIANFYFGDVNEDEQIMQNVIEQSLKEKKK